MIFILKYNTLKFYVKLQIFIHSTSQEKWIWAYWSHYSTTITVLLSNYPQSQLRRFCFFVICYLAHRKSFSLCSCNWVINSPWFWPGLRICFKQMDMIGMTLFQNYPSECPKHPCFAQWDSCPSLLSRLGIWAELKGKTVKKLVSLPLSAAPKTLTH